MSEFQGEKLSFDERVSQLREQTIERQKENISEASFALGGIFREVALRKAGLPAEDEATLDDLYYLAGTLAKSIGIESFIEGDPYSPTIDGAIVRNARKGANLNQGELAELVGVTRFTINRLEAGKVNPSEDLMRRLHEVLGIGEGSES